MGVKMKIKIFHIAFLIVSYLYSFLIHNFYHDKSVILNICVALGTILIVLIYFYFTYIYYKKIEIEKSDIIFPFIISILFVVLINLFGYFIKNDNSVISVLSITGAALIFTTVRLLSLKIKSKHQNIAKIIFIIVLIYFFAFIIVGTLNLFIPGIIKYNSNW